MKANAKRAPRRGRAFWTKLVAQFEASSYAQVEFAENHGVSLRTFRSWIYRLRAEARESEESSVSASATFVEVIAVAEASAGAGACRVRIGKVEVEFERVPSALYVAELMRRAAS